MFRIFLCPKTSVKLLLEQNKWSLEQKKLSFPIFIYSITIHKLSCSRKLAQAKYMDKKNAFSIGNIYFIHLHPYMSMLQQHLTSCILIHFTIAIFFKNASSSKSIQTSSLNIFSYLIWMDSQLKYFYVLLY